jgi:lysozyme family protein
MIDTFGAALRRVLRWEGGDVSDPHDPGGATRRGISLRFLRRIGLDVNGDGFIAANDVWSLANTDIEALYHKHFWSQCRCDDLPAGVDLLMFDCAVNQGPGVAARLLQKAAGVVVDGVIGPTTIAAARRPHVLLDFAALRAIHYTSLAALFTRYGFGWFRRLFDVFAAAREMQEEK